MNEIETHRYDYLRSKRYVVHEEHEQFIRPETLGGNASLIDKISSLLPGLYRSRR